MNADGSNQQLVETGLSLGRAAGLGLRSVAERTVGPGAAAVRALRSRPVWRELGQIDSPGAESMGRSRARGSRSRGEHLVGIKGLARWWAAGAVLALAACSGVARRAGRTPSRPHRRRGRLSPPGLGRDATRQGPAPAIAGARPWWHPDGAERLRPAHTGPQRGVLHEHGLHRERPASSDRSRSTSTTRRSGQMVLVPDLATDLGRPSHRLQDLEVHAAVGHQVRERPAGHRRRT